MSEDEWMAQLDAYLDGELPGDRAQALEAHLRESAACTTELLRRSLISRAMQSSTERYVPSAEFRARVRQQIAAEPKRGFLSRWLAVPAFLLALILAIAVAVYSNRQGLQRSYSELADLHVAALASPNPVDVVSSDRHTVKPWFQGKLPFTFNLPELQNSEFTLLGGRVTYLGQTPGAQLIYQIRKHEISVFIFQDRIDGVVPTSSGNAKQSSFNFSIWSENGLRYFAVGDANADDIQRLAAMLRAAG